MGQVYRATDVRLGRDVAVKLLSGRSQHEPDLVERFVQEARVTAALDRPNIVRLFDVGVHDGRPFLVMELLDGETLRHRLARGPLRPDEARRVALDVARGLVAAHAAALIHRDLKPENLFITTAGPTKILDFGVARLAPHANPQGPELATRAGALVGTAGYLAPEAILGEAADTRVDLFALGAILFEMLTGRRAFARDHTIDTLHAVLHDSMPPLDATSGASPDFAAIVGRLLEKAPEARFQSAADLAWTLERLNGTVAAPAVQPEAIPDAIEAGRRPRGPWRGAAVGACVAAAVALLLGAVWWRNVPTPVTPPMAASQFTWHLPDGMNLLSAPVVSPSGRQVAFVGGHDQTRQLFLRDLASLDAQPIAGTEGAQQPFWSPDGAEIGFFARGKLLKIRTQGGVPVPLADTPDPRGGTWGRTGTIVFQSELRDEALSQVSAAGGPVTPATLFDGTDSKHVWPAFLPDGVHFLYQAVGMNEARRGVYVGSTAQVSGPGTLLFPSESGATYVPPTGTGPGTILTVRSNGVEARTFDARTLALVGQARVIPVTAAVTTPQEAAMLGVSAEALAVAARPVPWGTVLVSMSLDGSARRIMSAQELTSWVRLSPDGRRLLRHRVAPEDGAVDIWVEDIDRGTRLRVTTGRDMHVSPTWSPRGDRVAYRAGPNGSPHLAIAQADGSGAIASISCPKNPCEPTDWSADGQWLLVNADRDVFEVPLEASASARPLLTAAFLERDARYSPDGRWVAYVSDESGRPEVLIRSMTGPAQRVAVSNQGGDQPVWQRDGTAIFYITHDGALHRVAITDAGSRLDLGRPRRMNVPAFPTGHHWGTAYDVSADGSRAYLHTPPEPGAAQDVTIVLGWQALLHAP
ncbi:MAG: protein kinase [Acidobacteriota bacterium]